jgi:hypothetical protein
VVPCYASMEPALPRRNTAARWLTGQSRSPLAQGGIDVRTVNDVDDPPGACQPRASRRMPYRSISVASAAVSGIRRVALAIMVIWSQPASSRSIWAVVPAGSSRRL